MTSPTPYGACADLRAVAEVCHRRSLPLTVDEAWGAHLPFHPDLPSWAMDAGADICGTSIHKMGSGLEQGSVFHLRGDLVPPALLGPPALGADLRGSGRLAAPDGPARRGADGREAEVPAPGELRMEQAMLPRDAFFGPAEEVPVSRAAGRIAAEMITPYPPGIPAVLPGERLTEPVLRYLRTGLEAGMHLPDPSDPALHTVRVVDASAA